MRRRRHRQQVSLFPFLAVLLSTLGALILLLLVVDQKARQTAVQKQAEKVAEARKLAAAAEVPAERDKEAEARSHATAEADRKQEKRREQLTHAAGELRRKHSSTADVLNRQQEELAGLQQRLLAETTQAADLEQAAQDRQAEVSAAAAREQTVVSAVAYLQEQVKLLEETLRRLKERASGPRPQLYALTPYKGRTATSRQPLYIECTAGGVCFRPDGFHLDDSEVRKPGVLASAVQQRFGQQMTAGTASSPYVLLLVRPSGIARYYSVLRALKDSPIDVGYEFIEEDWALDFTTPAPTGSPTAKAAKPSPGEKKSVASSQARPSKTPGVPISEAGAPAGDSPWTAPPRGTLAPPAGSREGSFGAIRRSSPLASSTQPGDGAPRGVHSGHAEDSGHAPGSQHGSEKPSGSPSFIKPILSDPRRPTAADRPRAATSGREPDAEPPSLPPPPGEEKPQSAAPDEGPPRAPAAPPGPSSILEKGQPAQKPRGVKPGGLNRSATAEWVIVIECSASAVVIQGHKTPIDPAQLAPSPSPLPRGGRGQGEGPDNPLLKTVREMVEQRKKKHPDVRPRLKYLIHADGLRVYYQASAALERLQLPATWEALADETNPSEGNP